LVNTNIGSDVIVDDQGSTTEDGIVEVRKEVILDVKDPDGNAVGGVTVYGTDTDHGERIAANQYNNNSDYLADRVYTGTTDLSGGLSFTGDEGSILMSLWIVENASTNTLDSRGLTNDTSDDFKMNAIAYDKSISSINMNLKGLGQLTQEVFMLPDLSLTELTKATVDLYSTLDTAQEFYDYAKSYLVDNYLGESDVIVSRSGNEIDAGSYDIVLDDSAGSVFDLTGNTITIKTSEFVGDLVTTGTITFSNGATIDGAYTDTNGSFANVNVIVTVKNINGEPIEGARVYVEAGSGGPLTQGEVILNGTSNASGVVSTVVNYTADQLLQNGRVRKSSSSPYYKSASFVGTITNGGFEIELTLALDE
jgi:hypothetical protein